MIKNTRSAFQAAFFILCLVPGLASADGTVLLFKVVNESGTPVAPATVCLVTHTNNGSQPVPGTSRKTNSDGYMALCLAQGIYSYCVSNGTLYNAGSVNFTT